MEMFSAAWKGCVISECLLFSCWENNTDLPLRSEASIILLMSMKFADTFNGTFFSGITCLGYFLFSPLCIAVRAELLASLQTRPEK